MPCIAWPQGNNFKCLAHMRRSTLTAKHTASALLLMTIVAYTITL